METARLENLKVPPKNEVKRYLPLRNKGNKFLWKSIAGDVLAYSMGLQIEKFDFDEFESQCKDYFDKNCEPALWPILSRTYFSDKEALLRLDPQFSVLGVASPKKSGAKANARMASVFKELLGTERLAELAPPALNFIELKILERVKKFLKPRPDETQPHCYLPFLQITFRKDLRFLSKHPQYMLAHFEEFLKLYAMAYSAQLALNVRSFEGKPGSRNLFFILANEKAGSERVHVAKDGMKLLRDGLYYVFPVLSMTEAIQAVFEGEPLPLWKFYQQLSQAGNEAKVVNSLNRYNDAFAVERKVSPPQAANSMEQAFKNLIRVALEQFNESTREGVNTKYVSQFEEHVFQDFTQNRGRAGRVLVLGQDQLLLLTNLVIGEKPKLWFKDILAGFQARGVYLDKRSEMALVEFYERIGNVERKSDSGDAIYITKTL